MLRMARAFCALSLLLSSSLAVADATPAAVSRRQLANGLTVLVQEDHGSPRVGISVVYGVGQRDDPRQYPGMATIVSQLMRGPTLHFPEGTEDALRATGLNHGIGAMRDHTLSMSAFPTSSWEDGCRVESDRMAYLLSSLQADAVDRAQASLEREMFRVLSWGDPLAETVASSLYPRDHPYRRLTARDPDVGAPRLNDLRWFFQAWYGPDNAVVAIVGDVDTEVAHAVVAKYFDPIRKSAVSRPNRPAAPPVNEDNGNVVTRYGGPYHHFPTEQVRVVWPTPGWFRDGDAALDVAASMLGQAVSERAISQRMATHAAASHSSFELGGELALSMSLEPTHSTPQAVALVDEVLAWMSAGTNPKVAFEKARDRALVNRLHKLSDVVARAAMLAQTAGYQQPQTVESDVERIRAVQFEDVQRAVVRYLSPQRRVIVTSSTRDRVLR